MAPWGFESANALAARHRSGFADHIPDVRYEVLHGTGHLPHLEGHARCLEAITAFLEGVGS
jgi:pimeloyl-ACP methyl ester carboxylesterase